MRPVTLLRWRCGCPEGQPRCSSWTSSAIRSRARGAWMSSRALLATRSRGSSRRVDELVGDPMNGDDGREKGGRAEFEARLQKARKAARPRVGILSGPPGSAGIDADDLYDASTLEK